MECILGCTIEEYENYLAECISTANDCAAKLHDVTKDVSKAKVAGGSAAIAGGGHVTSRTDPGPNYCRHKSCTNSWRCYSSGCWGLISLGANITESCYNKEQLSKIKPVIGKLYDSVLACEA